MGYFKKGLCALASLALVSGLVPAVAHAEDVQAGEVVEVASLEDLQAVSARVAGGDSMKGVTVRLIADIDMAGSNFTPIGSDQSVDGTPFSGTFDGGGHAIANLTVYTALGDMNKHQWLGLFGETDGATVSDLVLKEASVSGSSLFSSQVALLCANAKDSSFSNCSVSGRVANQGSSLNSGFGGMFVEISGTQVVDCTLTSNLSASSAGQTGSGSVSYSLVGGIVRRAANGSSIRGCTVSGSIVSGVSAGSATGAIVGELEDSAVSGCTNRAAITAHMNEAGYLGGIVGSAVGSSVSDCVNYAAVTCDNANAGNNMEPVGGYVAGIAGNVERSTVTRCLNAGEVRSESRHYERFENPQEKYAAGLVSRAVKATSILQSANVGAVTSDIEGLDLAYAYSAGAVCLLSSSEISDVYTAGAIGSRVDAESLAAGSKTAKKLKCRSAGLVLTASEATVTRCYALGKVASKFSSPSIFDPELDAVCVDREESTFADVAYWRGVHAPESEVGTALTGSQVADPASWAAFTADSAWRATEAAPVLSWQPADSLTPTVDADIDIAGAAISLSTSKLVYTGKALEPAVSVALDGAALVSGSDYSISYASNVKVGTARVSVTGLGRYVGQVEATFEIGKAANGLRATLSKRKAKRGSSVSIKVSGANGKVSSAVSGKNVSVRKGKVVIGKKAKTGMRFISVTAKGDANHKAKTVKLKLRVIR